VKSCRGEGKNCRTHKSEHAIAQSDGVAYNPMICLGISFFGLDLVAFCRLLSSNVMRKGRAKSKPGAREGKFWPGDRQSLPGIRAVKHR
jgi:hypothetical protein